MSAPNKSYDPVEVEALKPEEIERMRDEALAAFAAAGDLDALQEAKVAHTGAASPLALANREIGALPPHAKAAAGKLVGQARGAVNKALATRQAELEADRDARVLVEEAVDVTLPYDRVPPGARHPLTTMMERVADVFVSMGYEIAEGPEVEAEWFNFDALNFTPDHPARRLVRRRADRAHCRLRLGHLGSAGHRLRQWVQG
jgi:phenylalanyl-tRNA synthetase alpha chain